MGPTLSKRANLSWPPPPPRKIVKRGSAIAAERNLGRMMSLRLPQHLPENVLPILCQIRDAATILDSFCKNAVEEWIHFANG